MYKNILVSTWAKINKLHHDSSAPWQFPPPPPHHHVHEKYLCNPRSARSSSLPHHLWPSCRLDWFILHYCTRNCMISTMVFLLQYGHHDRKRGRWDCRECKWIFIAILPHKSLGQFSHSCSFLWSPRLGAQDALKGTFHRLHTRFDNQPDIAEFEWVALARQSSCCGNSHDCAAKQR